MIVVVYHVASVARLIDRNIGGVRWMLLFKVDLNGGDETAVTIKYLNPVVSGICDINLA